MAEAAIKNEMNEFLTAYTALWVDLPFAGLRMGLGTGDGKEATEAAWKSYDATVKLVSAVTDDLYRNPVVGEITASALDGMLRVQKVGSAMTGAFFTGLWKTVNLPTAGEIQALREEVCSLAERSQPVELQVTPKMKPAANTNEVIHLHRKVA